MSAPFVTTLRARGLHDPSRPEGGPAITIRVEMPEVWDVVRVVAAPERTRHRREDGGARGSLSRPAPEEMVVKLRGWEILDEMASLADSGVLDGSILVMMFRRRRPVR